MIVENKRNKTNNEKSAQDVQKDQDFVVTARYLSDEEGQSEFAQANLNYNDYFGLEEAPFSISPNPRFLYMSEHHQEALAHLLYGVSAANGFVLLTGEVGTGKTTVIRAFLQHLPADARVAYIVHAKMTATELLETIAEELNIELGGHHSVRNMVNAIHKKLLEHYATGYRTYLLIDEAQNLTPEVLEEIRLLTNLETDAGKLLHIILVGQTELRDMFQSYELRQLNQRITARYHLHQLSLDDVTLYVQHRLAVAKSQRNPFSPKALRAVAQYSKGVPRLINVICDRALLAAFSRHQLEIDQGLVKEAAKEVLGRIALMPWERSEKLETTQQEKGLGKGTKAMLAAIAVCMAAIAVGPYAGDWWHQSAIPLVEKYITAEDSASNLKPVELKDSPDIAPVKTVVEEQSDFDVANTEKNSLGRQNSQRVEAPLQEVETEEVETAVAVVERTDESPLQETVTSAQPAEPAEDNSTDTIFDIKAKQQVASTVEETVEPTDDAQQSMDEPSQSLIEALPDLDKQKPINKPELAEVKEAPKPVSGNELDRVMSFEQGLLALRQMNAESVNAEEAAEILSTGCNALQNTGCLQLERSVRQLVRMDTPFLFKLAPAQMRSLGINFAPPSAAGLTRHTWFIATGYNRTTEELQVKSQDWIGNFPVDELEEVFVDRGIFIMKTPLRSIPKGHLLGEDEGQWIIQHIGFADGSRLDPAFDIIVSKETLSTAVRAFQKRRGLAQDGLFGVRTLVELNREVDPTFPQLQKLTND